MLSIEDGVGTVGIGRTAALFRMTIDVVGEASLRVWRLDRGYWYCQSWVGYSLGFLNLSGSATHIVRRGVNRCRSLLPGPANMQLEFRPLIRIRVRWDGHG